MNSISDECSICFEELQIGSTLEPSATAFNRTVQSQDTTTLLPCKHQFHYDCINQWTAMRSDCPMCRSDIVSSTPALANSVNLAKALLKSIESNQVSLAKACLAAGLTQQECIRQTRKNPLNEASWGSCWEIAAELIEAGYTTQSETAQNNLGCMYEHGLGVEINYAKALQWYRKAAEQGNHFAQLGLGWLLENGLGVEPNEAEALDWYLKAANQNNLDAQNNVGAMYRDGRGGQQSDDSAVDWFRKAAEQVTA